MLLVLTWHSPCRTGSPSPPCRWPPCCSPRSCPRGRTRTRTRGDTRPPPPAAARLSAGTFDVFFYTFMQVRYHLLASMFTYKIPRNAANGILVLASPEFIIPLSIHGRYYLFYLLISGNDFTYFIIFPTSLWNNLNITTNTAKILTEIRFVPLICSMLSSYHRKIQNR